MNTASNDNGKNTRISNIDLQYNRFSEDWRHVNSIIWQIPSIAISIMAGIAYVAFQILEDWPRILLLSAGSLFMFVLAVVVVRQIVVGNTRLFFLQYLEAKVGMKVFPTGLHEDQSQIREMVDENPNENITIDPFGSDRIFLYLNKQSSRRWLMYLILILSLLLGGSAVASLLLDTDILKFLFNFF